MLSRNSIPHRAPHRRIAASYLQYVKCRRVNYQAGGLATGVFVRAFHFAFCILFFCCSADGVLAGSPQAAALPLPDQPDAFQNGLRALQDNRIEDALKELTIAENEQPADALVRNFRGIVLARLGQNSEAAAEYREAIRLQPRAVDAYRNLGFLEWHEHQLDAARETLRQAIQISPGDSFAHYYLSRVLLDSRQYLAAVQELEISRLPMPMDAGSAIQIATAYLALGRMDDARKSLDKISAPNLTTTQALQVASLLLALHQPDAAIGLLEELRTRPPGSDSPWLRFDLALVYLIAGDDKKAAEQAQSYNNDLSNTPSDSNNAAAGWSLLGIARARLQEGERSVDALRQAAALAPAEEEHWLNLTRELMELARFPEAVAAAQSALIALPRSYALHLRLGAAQLSAGHYAEAESVFRDLVVAGDPLPTGYIGLAQVLLRTGHAEEAISELTAARRKLGSSFLISYFLGLSYVRADRRTEAMTAFQEALVLNPGNAEAHLNLGKTELALGQVQNSIAQFKEALRLSPGNVQTKRLLSQAYRRVGDTQAAEKFAAVSSTDDAPAEVEDLLGDFFLPQWQQPLAAQDNHR